MNTITEVYQRHTGEWVTLTVKGRVFIVVANSYDRNEEHHYEFTVREAAEAEMIRASMLLSELGFHFLFQAIGD